jgi:signal transduction histidine kinase
MDLRPSRVDRHGPREIGAGSDASTREAPVARYSSASRTLFVLTLAGWAAVALLFAALPEGFAGKVLLAVGAYWAAAAFAVTAVANAALRTGGDARRFWAFLGGGLLFKLAGDAGWIGFRYFGPNPPGLVLQDLAYAISYLLLFAALLWLVALTTRRITLVVALDALSVMLSVGVLVRYFVLGPVAERAGLDTWHEGLVALGGPACNAGLLVLGYVVLCATRRPPFAGLLAAAFFAFLLASGLYLGSRFLGASETSSGTELLWALGLALCGLAALRTAPSSTFASQSRIRPWRVLCFWCGPLSPALHYGLLLGWGAFDPPVPRYVLLGGVGLMVYFAVRMSMVPYVSRRLGEDQEAAARRRERERIVAELHDNLKQSIPSISMMIKACKGALGKGDHHAAERLLDRALEVSREASCHVTRPVFELQGCCQKGTVSQPMVLRHLMSDFEKYFDLRIHGDLCTTRENLCDPLEQLNGDKLASAYRIVNEALWNAAKHARAENVWVESRCEGSALILKVRDDGRGFRAEETPPGLGLSLMRGRAEEIGAKLEIRSAPDQGTTVELRIE